MSQKAYICGTLDTKDRELVFIRDCIADAGFRTALVDLSSRHHGADHADVRNDEVAAHHPDGPRAVFVDERGEAVAAMALAFERFLRQREDVGGIIGAGGSGGTALISPALRALPIGTPKVLVSTVASGNVAGYIGPSDICMMYSVTDILGLNSISRRVLANAAHALAGMLLHHSRPSAADTRASVAMTMFGVTTPCVQAASRALEADHEVLVFHATGTGGQSMEKLVDSELVNGVLDITTTEVCDLLVGGVFSAGEDRLGAMIRKPVPYVGSCGAIDMVNFGAIETVPEHFRRRTLHVHNPHVTLMRTTAEENEECARWIGERLNRMPGPVRFVLPEGGVSALDAPEMAFHDPAADEAFFKTLEEVFEETDDHRLWRLPYHINEPAFAEALVAAYREVAGSERDRR